MNLADPARALGTLHQLVELSRHARRAASLEELAFMAVNDTLALCDYRQAALWLAGGGLKALSGVVELESNAPYAHWLGRVCSFLHGQAGTADLPGQLWAFTADQLPEALAAEWAEWLPAHALWIPIRVRQKPGAGEPATASGGLLLAGAEPWSADSLGLLSEWMAAWSHAWRALARPATAWPFIGTLHGGSHPDGGASHRPRWWKRPRTALAAAALAAMGLPVHLSVLAPGEIVPANPAVIRAPVDGVIGQFQVRPNEAVKAGQALFHFDEAPIAARLEVALQALATAEAEYRQQAQQAVSDARSKPLLASALGKIEEKRAEADYVKGQFDRSRVSAPQDGIALFDDPGEWIGKPVQTGERVMRIAAPGEVEVEAWLPIGDAIPLSEDASVTLYLAANPLQPLSATVRYLAHDAVARPDGTYAYRLRARLTTPTEQRVGMKGTAKLSGDWVPLGYWVFRRPLATVRQALGV
jgi:hypothetical protein